MKEFMNIVSKIEEHICAIGLLSTIALVFANVVLRYIFKSSSSWVEEAVRYITIWFTFIGAAICFKRGTHMGIDLILTLTKGKVKKGIQLFGVITSILFMLFLLVYGIQLVIFTMKSGQISPALEIPLFWIFIGVPLGAFLSLIELIGVFFRTIKYDEQAVTELEV